MSDFNVLSGPSASPVTAPAVARESGLPKKGGILSCISFLRPAGNAIPRSRIPPPVSSIDSGRSRIQELMPKSRASGQPGPIQEPHEPVAQEPPAPNMQALPVISIEQMGRYLQDANVLPDRGEFMFRNWQAEANPMIYFFPKAFTGRGAEYERIGRLLDTCNQKIKSFKEQDSTGSAAVQKLSELHEALTELQTACDRYGSNPKHKNKVRKNIVDQLGKEQTQTMLDTVRQLQRGQFQTGYLQTDQLIQSLSEGILGLSDHADFAELTETRRENVRIIENAIKSRKIPLTPDTVRNLRALMQGRGMENIFGDISKATAADSALHSIEHKLTGEEILAAELATHAGRSELAALKPEQFWKMSMDMHGWEKGPNRFENEPGYMGGMARGWAQMLKEIDAPLTLDLLVRMHDAAVDGVKSFILKSLDKGLRTLEGGFPLKMLKPEDECYRATLTRGGQQELAKSKCYVVNLTPEGLQQLKEKTHYVQWSRAGRTDIASLTELISEDFPENFPWKYPHVFQFDEKTGKAFIHSNYIREDFIEAFISNYDSAISIATNDDDKLWAIANLVQEFEQAHVFHDGNARTTGFLLLNKLLVQNNLTPTMIEDPNWFDGFSVGQLVDAIKAGQQRFKKYVDGEEV